MLDFDKIYKKAEKNDGVALDDKKDTLVVYEEDKIKQFLIAISRGATLETACGYAELLPKTIKKWLAEGESDADKNENTNKSEFYFRYKKAQSIFELNNLSVIKTQAENGNWSAASWLLERRLPESYSSKQEVKVGSENLQINVDIPKMS